MAAEISGQTRPGFEKIRDAFAAALTDSTDMGAALSIWVEGEHAVQLWGGIADARSKKSWQADTATVIFSCTKGLMSIIAAHLVTTGQLDYARPVAAYWPEFAAGGKQDITVAELLAHRAGLSAPRENLSLTDILDWNRVTRSLAAQEPLWCMGDGYAYHALTHGWLAGELVKRVTGKTPGTLLKELISDPLGVPAWIGLPQEAEARVAYIGASRSLAELWGTEAEKPAPNWPFKAMTLGNALPATLISESGGFNDPALHRAEIPGAGGIATADALATIWSATVTETKGVRLLDDAIVARATQTQSEGAPVFDTPPPYSRWGMGFQLDSEARHYLGPRSFGHDGAGGQVGFADPERRVGFGFVTNWMMGPDDNRAARIIKTLQEIL